MTDERNTFHLIDGSNVTFDLLVELLAYRFEAWAKSLEPPTKRRGKPPKTLRDALAMVAAFEAAEIRQLRESGSSKKHVSLDTLGYSKSDGKDNADRALKAARQTIKAHFPGMTWTCAAELLPGDPSNFDLEFLERLSPELAKRGLAAIWMTGDGAPPRLGETWTGRAIAVFLPVGFKPREKEDVAVMHVEDYERLEF